MSKNYYQVAVLIDAGYLLHKAYHPLGKRLPTAEEIVGFSQRSLQDGEQLFRIYYYDCPPFAGQSNNPIDHTLIDYSNTPTARTRNSLNDRLEQAHFLAFRQGILKKSEWKITGIQLKELIKEKRAVRPKDVCLDFKQKRVDIKIGLDVAWLSSKRIVDKIILVTGDTDFVPAMKFARREGVQVIVASPSKSVSTQLKAHSDEFRNIPFTFEPLGNQDIHQT